MNGIFMDEDYNVIKGFSNKFLSSLVKNVDRLETMELSDEFLIPQVPTTDGNWLYDVFFQLRLDHPEIFWASGFKYKYYPDAPNLILIPEYLFDKGKIREHQKAMGARVEIETIAVK